MIVVSNTSPLTNLAAIGQFDLLHQLYGDVHIAEGVWEELNAGPSRTGGWSLLCSATWTEAKQKRLHSHWNSVRRWCFWMNAKAAGSPNGSGCE